MPRPLSLAALLVFAPPLALVACADAPPPAAAPPQPPPGVVVAGQAHDASPIDREMLAIGQAEEEIDRLFPGAGAPINPRKGGPPPPPPPKPGDREVPRDVPKEEPRAAGLLGDPCTVACKALASMVSSAERLCHLAGENDGRCDDARARVRGASARVKSSCPGCAVSVAPAASPKGTPGPEAPKGPAPGMPGSSTGFAGSPRGGFGGPSQGPPSSTYRTCRRRPGSTMRRFIASSDSESTISAAWMVSSAASKLRPMNFTLFWELTTIM